MYVGTHACVCTCMHVCKKEIWSMNNKEQHSVSGTEGITQVQNQY